MMVESYRLGLACCFCGASVEVDEASRCARCGYCGAALKIVRADSSPTYVVENSLTEREVRFLIERHLKTTGMPLVSRWTELRRFHVPFWRIRGTAFYVREREDAPRYESGEGSDMYEPPQLSESKPVPEVAIVPKDVSFCADHSLDWGLESLGVRSQALRLAPLSKEHLDKSTILPPTVTRLEAIDRFHQSTTALARAGGRLMSDNVQLASVSTSLICFPLWIGRFVDRFGHRGVSFDPLSKRTISVSNTDDEIHFPVGPVVTGSGSIEVVPHRCPECGADLPMRERSVAYICENCHRTYLEHQSGYAPVTIKTLRTDAGHEIMMPFWAFEIDAGGDSVILLNLANCRDRKLLAPAFGISNPSRLMKLVSHYSAGAGSLEFDSAPLDRYTFADVALSREQASELISPLLWAMAVNRGLDPNLQASRSGVKVSGGTLVWIPFSEEGYFLRERVTGAAIEKASLAC